MSQALVFDTLKYAKKLKTVGFTEEQAEVQAEELASVIKENLASKQDLKELEFRLTFKVGVMIAASIAIISALVKLL